VAKRDAVRWLSGRPAGAWPQGAVHHGVRVGILLLLAILTQFFFPAAPVPDFPVLERGMVAERDIIAEVAFPIYKTEEELAREREEAARSVAPVFEFRPEAVDTMLARVSSFLTRIDSAVAAGSRPEAGARSPVRELLESYGLPVTPEQLEVFHSPRQRALLGRSVELAIRRELAQGIVSTSDLEESAAPQVRLHWGGAEELVERDSIRTAARFYERASRHLVPGSGPEVAELQRRIVIRFFEPSIRLNRPATEAARVRARQAVPLVKGEVLQGERVIAAHEQVREADLERLTAYREHLVQLGRLSPGVPTWSRVLGALLHNFLILGIFGVLLFYFRPGIYGDMRHVLLLAVLIIALVGMAAGIARSGWPSALIPIAFPALAIAALWDGRLAFKFVAVLAVLLTLQGNFLSVSVLFTLIMGGTAAALAVRVVHSRSQTYVFVAVIAGAYAAAAITLALLRSWEPGETLWVMGWGLLNATGSAMLAMGFLPLFESWTRVTTDQTLLELADFNRPLLRRLSLEAPGTYAHSISVANLAEAGARAIGANALLTRVGVYYHDVGKIGRPQFFIENQPQGRNPHDRLKPQLSAAVVRNHVQEGLRLAEQYKLPGVIKAFIAEHHGTQPISFFFDKAREQDPQVEHDPADFRYPGPRPRSQETAIVMLADSVESATRVLQDPTPERIRALVDRIVEGKLELGQLDETPLTMRDLTRIKEEFVKILAGMYHQRIDYPPRDAAPQPELAPPAVARRS
jgi:cyclic-di-AMP phosphodiesterase PgpH